MDRSTDYPGTCAVFTISQARHQSYPNARKSASGKEGWRDEDSGLNENNAA
jgi:hypothetical protein